MRGRAGLSAKEARWLAIDAQGLARPRPTGPITLRHLRKVTDAIGVVQLDAINVLARTQFLVMFARLGAYERERFMAMTGPGAELWEYWGHMASLQAADTEPLFRHRMATGSPYGDTPLRIARREAWYGAHGAYVAKVLAEVRERGPLSAGQLSDPQRRDGEWWDRRSLGRQALEWLFAHGQIAGWRTANFERVYDVPERVLPPAVLSQPTPTVEEAQRQLLLSSVGPIGVGTVRDLADYYRIPVNQAKPRVAELVEDGALVAVTVEGWREPGYMLPRARPRRPTRTEAALLSPFDSLVWERARTSRLFGFDYRIEVYTPAPQRTFGYFVLPVLLGDALVGRLDLKADRNASVLRVPAAHAEPGVEPASIAPAIAAELHAMREWLGLSDVAVGANSTLARALQRTTRSARS
jgi:uncharacterized protein YcaQ